MQAEPENALASAGGLRTMRDVGDAKMMRQLASRHLLTLTLDVDFAGVQDIGAVPAGRRRIALVTGGSFSGERLRGTVVPGGADWVSNRPDAVMTIDVRLTLRTDDDALIALAYTGSFVAAPDVMKRFNRGERLQPDEYRLRTVARLECGAEAYRWLNDLVVVGVGAQGDPQPTYELFQIL